MDTVTEDHGQALVFAVLLLGVAAAVIVGLLDVQQRILSDVRDQRAGEAAVAAAGRVVADSLFARTGRGTQHLTQDATARLAGDPEVIDAARLAAASMASENGRSDPTEVTVHAYGYEIEVHLTLAGRRHIALLEPAP